MISAEFFEFVKHFGWGLDFSRKGGVGGLSFFGGGGSDLHSAREELRGIVPVRRTVRMARVRSAKARDLQRYSSRTGIFYDYLVRITGRELFWCL